MYGTWIPINGLVNGTPVNNYTTTGELHYPNLPNPACGEDASNFPWINYYLPTNVCVSNNFTFSFVVRNNRNSGGRTTSDITIEVQGQNNWTMGCTFLSNNTASPWAYGWVGTNPGVNPSVNGPAGYVTAADDNYHTITLAYNNGQLTITRDNVQMPLLGAPNSPVSICRITSIRVQFKGNGFLNSVQGVDNVSGLNWLETFNNGPQLNPPSANCPVAGVMGINVQAPTCLSNTLTLTATGSLPPSPTFSWSGPNGQTSSSNPFVISNPTPALVNGIWNVATSGGCIANSASDSVKIQAPGIGLPQRHDTSSCTGDTIRLTASGGASYAWTQLGGGTATISGGNSATPLVWPSSTTTYLATITTGSCSRVDTFRVTTTVCHCEDSCNWSLTGNTNVKPNYYIGPRNAANFNIRTNNIQRMVVSATGCVGINTTQPVTRLDVDAIPYKYDEMLVKPVSGVRFRNLGTKAGTPLVVDADGYVWKQGPADIDVLDDGHGGGLDDGNGGVLVEGKGVRKDVDQLRQEVDALKQQVQLLMKALQTPIVQAGANTLEIVPTPFDKQATAQYSLENFSGKALLQVSDASGRVLKTFPVPAAKGSIAVGNFWAADGVLVFSIIDSGKVVISVRSMRQSH